jgi:wyosine [tRNA(Phe)-imidazoG37] synthetase (radical SAM superfamily)
MASVWKTQRAQPESALSRLYLGNRFVYVVLCPRAGGLTIGVDLTPDTEGVFASDDGDVHCDAASSVHPMDVDAMEAELSEALALVRSGEIRKLAPYRLLPDDLVKLRHVALSGELEPTLAPEFPEALQAVIHVRALSGPSFLKLVLVTNGAGLDLPRVQHSLRHLTRSDEIWIKLNGGTQAYINQVNRGNLCLEKILSNIVALGQERPVIIHSLFPAIHDSEPPQQEIERYANRLRELKQQGAEISMVQIYSATPSMAGAEFRHLPLRALSRIAATVRQVAGLRAEVF